MSLPRAFSFSLLILPLVAFGQRALPSGSPRELLIESPSGQDRYEGGLVVRRSVSLAGTINGALVVLDEAADISMTATARLRGDIVLPTEKNTRQVGPPGVGLQSEARISSSLRLDSSSLARAEVGRIRTATSFELPKISTPVGPVAEETFVVQGATSPPTDFSKVGDFTLRKPGDRVAIPPGNYGRLTVANGIVVLGTPGAKEAVRYEFRSLEVQAGGRIETAGTVVVLVATGSVWRGMIGSADSPLSLDLRVARGDVTIAGTGSLHGFLTAPESRVSIAHGGVLTGGVMADQLEVAAGATVQAVEPDWSSASNERTRPRFPHKALRLHSNVPGLQSGFRHSYYPGVSYIDDVPYLMLAEGKRPRSHPMATYEERRALVEACRALFDQTGFDRAGIVLTGYSDAPGTAPAIVRNLALTRLQVEALFKVYEEKAAFGGNGRPISTQVERVDEFYERCLAIGLIQQKGP